MSRYMIQFYKKGNMRYISHLDLLRLFKRTFKRTGIKLIYSQGFNPHPKMSFVQPLSLGYSSNREYLDFETMEDFPCEQIITDLNIGLPAGVGVAGCRSLPPSKRTLAAVVECASYAITAKLSAPAAWREKIPAFLAQNEILIEKTQKKSGKLVEQNIRPMILELDPGTAGAQEFEGVHVNDNNFILLTALIAAGSNRNLNPETLLSAFCRFCEAEYAPEETSVTRLDLYYTVPGTDELASIMEYRPETQTSATPF